MSNKGDQQTVRRSFKTSVVIDGAKTEFSKGLGVGVIGSQVVTFDLLPSQYEGAFFLSRLKQKHDEFRDELIKMDWKEIDPKDA